MARTWSERIGRALAQPLTRKEGQEWLLRFPVQNILVCVGAGGTDVMARYSYTAAPSNAWRIQQWRPDPNRPWWRGYYMTDIRTRGISWVETALERDPTPEERADAERMACVRRGHVFYRDNGARRWYERRPDFDTISAAVEFIRDVHGPIRVQWNIPEPDGGISYPRHPNTGRLGREPMFQ